MVIDPIITTPKISDEIYKPIPTGQQGWICPKCGRGNAPWNQFCPCVGWPKYEATC